MSGDALPVAEHWWRTHDAGDDVTLLVEAHITPMLESNVWHVRGRDADLVIDTANGIGALRPAIDELAAGRPVIAVATHGHFDHVGGLAEFDDRRCHEGDAAETRVPFAVRIERDAQPDGVEEMFAYYGFEVPERTIEALAARGLRHRGVGGARRRADLVRRRRRRDRPRRPPARSAARARPHARVDRPVGGRHRAAVQRRHRLRRGEARVRRSRGGGGVARPARRAARTPGARGPRPQLRRRRVRGAARRTCCTAVSTRSERRVAGSISSANATTNVASAPVHPGATNRNVIDRQVPAHARSVRQRVTSRSLRVCSLTAAGDSAPRSIDGSPQSTWLLTGNPAASTSDAPCAARCARGRARVWPSWPARC